MNFVVELLDFSVLVEHILRDLLTISKMFRKV
jgi:hypothetical protein